jgi:serine/threonine-protein kinase
MRLDLANRAVRALCDAPQARGGTWNHAGQIVFSPGLFTGLFEVSESGGTPTDIGIPKAAKDSLRVPRFLPDGDHVLFLRFPVVGPSHIEVLSLASKQSSVLLQADAAAQYSTTGHQLFVRGSNLFAHFDPGQLRLSSQPAIIAAGVQVDPARRTAAFSVSNSGLLVYAPGSDPITGWAVSSDSGCQHYSQCVADRRFQMMPPTCGRNLSSGKNENFVIFTSSPGQNLCGKKSFFDAWI